MDKLTLKRGSRVLAPSVFTVGNMACGFYALLAAYRGEFSAAATSIIRGMAFDSLDGRVARLVHGDSTFGVEFDSLSDFLTFGVAPGYMMYAFILKDYGTWGYPMAFVYALCGALRLARFNAVAHDSGGSKTHFTGLPIPGAAGFLASFVLLYQIIEEGRPAHTWKFLMAQIPALAVLAPLMVLGAAFLMVSTIPYPAFKQMPLLQLRSPKRILAFVVVAVILFVYRQTAAFVLFFGYTLLGPVSWLMHLPRRMVRPKPKPSASAPPTAV